MAQLPLGLTKNNLLYSRPKGRNLITRTEQYHEWVDARREGTWWPYTTILHGPPRPQALVANETGAERVGINFASQDYLSLSSHPAVQEAASRALQTYGPHSAGSPVLQGNTVISRELERSLGEALQMEHVLLYPTGWGAGYGAVTGLVRPGDAVVMDQLAHACLQAGAAAATPNIIKHKHLEVAAIPEILAELRHNGHDRGILVITEGLFSMDADIPELRQVQEACREHDATLLVDVAHDFGSMGPGGGGALAMQKLLGEVDLVMGSFSKTFASNGGFVASRSAAVYDFLKMFSNPHTFSNALSPVQAAVVTECLRIVRSPEGEERRQKMLAIATRLREELAQRQIECVGVPSPIVPAVVGAEPLARLASRRMREHAVFANLVEFPAVAVNSARFRLQVMADHEVEHAVAAADALHRAIAEAQVDLERIVADEHSQHSPAPTEGLS